MTRAVLLALVLVALLPGAAAAGVSQGEHLYGRFCVSCHGPNGVGRLPAPSGTGPARDQAVLLGSGPPLLGVGARAADFYLRTGYMPLKRNGIQPRRSRLLLGNAQIDALVRYVSSLGKGPAIPHPHPERGNVSAGLALFRSHCAGCHQIVGEGGYVTDAVPPELGDATPTQIAEAVRIGPYVMPKFSTKAISDKQLNSIIRYVEYANHPDNRGGWALGNIGPIPEGLVSWFFAGSVLLGVCLVIGKRLHGQG
jgi:ubiquinol-cytochrome c reductase cytochrome c subunit